MIIHSPIFSGSISQASNAYANLSGSFTGSITGSFKGTIEVEQDDGSILEVRMVDGKDIMMSSDEQPTDLFYRRLD